MAEDRQGGSHETEPWSESLGVTACSPVTSQEYLRLVAGCCDRKESDFLFCAREDEKKEQCRDAVKEYKTQPDLEWQFGVKRVYFYCTS